MAEPFATINGQAFYVKDWIKDSRVTDLITPALVTSVEEQDGELVVWMESPVSTYFIVTLSDFIARVMSGVYTRIEKPKYHIGEKFVNRFTYKTLEIMDIPRLRNEQGGDYMYYVLEYSPTFGFNHNVRKEQDITYFYINEGAERL